MAVSAPSTDRTIFYNSETELVTQPLPQVLVNDVKNQLDQAIITEDRLKLNDSGISGNGIEFKCTVIKDSKKPADKTLRAWIKQDGQFIFAEGKIPVSAWAFGRNALSRAVGKKFSETQEGKSASDRVLMKYGTNRQLPCVCHLAGINDTKEIWRNDRLDRQLDGTYQLNTHLDAGTEKRFHLQSTDRNTVIYGYTGDLIADNEVFLESLLRVNDDSKIAFKAEKTGDYRFIIRHLSEDKVTIKVQPPKD